MEIYPAAAWETRGPEDVGLAAGALDEMARLVGGRGCVVRHGVMAYAWGDQRKSGDIASAFKPVLSTLLLYAVQERRIRSVDSRVSEFEPRLTGKDAAITWRHLASQTSGYGLAEAPGAAWAYNDHALALYYDTLIAKVFRSPGDRVLERCVAGPLQFEDRATFEAFGPDDRPGRLALSVRDFARFGLLILRGGVWRGRRRLRRDLLTMALHRPVPAETPRTSGREAPMSAGQRSVGGGKDQTPVGPGFYSFNWWCNGRDRLGRRLFADLPADTFAASGHGGMRMLWIVPSRDLLVVWNDANVEDQDACPENPQARCNQAARLIARAAAG